MIEIRVMIMEEVESEDMTEIRMVVTEEVVNENTMENNEVEYYLQDNGRHQIEDCYHVKVRDYLTTEREKTHNTIHKVMTSKRS